MNLYDYVSPLLSHYTKITIPTTLLETPTDRTMGDVALPCFQLAKELKQSPQAIATDIAASIFPTAIVSRIEATWPYVNFFLDTAFLAERVFSSLNQTNERYGAWAATGQRVVLESPSPNTNKPLHLGHVRNMLLGNALDAIMNYAGYETVKVEIVNDRGVHICKSMRAYQQFGNNAEPDKKSDHYVGDRYVRYAQEATKNPELEQIVQTMLVNREQGDPETITLREKMRKRCLDGMQQTYARYGCRIDKVYYESETYLHGKEMVELGIEKEIFFKDEKGNIAYSNEQAGIDKKVVLRANGTSVYLTQDLYLAQCRERDRHMDRMVYIVGNEQEYHFKALFAMLRSFGFPFADQCFHLGYGMISLPDGKMKSREGNVVDADTLAQDMHDEAATILRERTHDTLDDAEVARRAEAIAMAAIKFFVLKYDALKDFVFDPATSLSFEGETGPYIQYTYARCCSVLEKAWRKKFLPDDVDMKLFSSKEERLLLLHLADFPNQVTEAAERYQPYLIARYVLDLAHMFNTYYQQHTILQDDKALERARVHMVAAVRHVLGIGLSLLWIELLERM